MAQVAIAMGQGEAQVAAGAQLGGIDHTPALAIGDHHHPLISAAQHGAEQRHIHHIAREIADGHVIADGKAVFK